MPLTLPPYCQLIRRRMAQAVLPMYAELPGKCNSTP